MSLSTPATAILWSHPYGQTEQWTPGYTFYALAHAAQQEGWLFAATLEGGDLWGNSAAQTDLLDLYTLLNGRQALSKVVLVGASMGALPTALAYAAGSIPNVVGAYLIDGALSLSNLYASSSFTTSIDTAYGITRSTLAASVAVGATSVSSNASYANGTSIMLGNGTANAETVTVNGTPTGTGPYTIPITATANTHNSGDQISDYPTKTSGHDPLLVSAASYAAKKFRMLSSSADTTVNEAANTLAFQSHISGQAAESSQVEHLVGHLQGGAINPSDFVATVKRWIA